MRKKILFILDGPNPTTAGGILVDKIIKSHGIDCFKIIGLRNNIKANELSVEYNDDNFRNFPIRIPKTNYFFKILKKLPFIETLYILIRVFFIKTKIIEHTKNQKFDLVFTILRGDLLLVINMLVKSLNVPLIAFDTDTVESEFNDHKLIYWLKKQNFYKVLPRVSSMVTIGETMRDLYKDKFNIDSIILRLPFNRAQNNPVKIIKNEINVIFVGNVYAKTELECFISAMDIFLSSSTKFSINLFIATHKPINVKTEYVNIINLGWVSEEILISYLQKSHIAYLPYKFDIKFDHQMKYAFPSKSGQYITYNLPIFFHGPQYSSFNHFLDKYEVGISCNSLLYSDIIKVFKIMLNDRIFYSHCQNECNRAYEDEFSEKIFSNKVKTLFSL